MHNHIRIFEYSSACSYSNIRIFEYSNLGLIRIFRIFKPSNIRTFEYSNIRITSLFEYSKCRIVELHHPYSAHMPIFASLPTTADAMFSTDDSETNIIKIHNICSKNIENFDRDLELLNFKFLDLKIDESKSAHDCLNDFNKYYNELHDI